MLSLAQLSPSLFFLYFLATIHSSLSAWNIDSGWHLKYLCIYYSECMSIQFWPDLMRRNILLASKEGLNCAGNISSSTPSAGWDVGVQAKLSLRCNNCIGLRWDEIGGVTSFDIWMKISHLSPLHKGLRKQVFYCSNWKQTLCAVIFLAKESIFRVKNLKFSCIGASPFFKTLIFRHISHYLPD